MVRLAEVREQADALSLQEKELLLVHLLGQLQDFPEGPDDDEVKRRDAEMISGEVESVSHESFIRDVTRGR